MYGVNALETYADKIDTYIEAMLKEESPYVAGMAGYFFGWLDEHFQPVSGVRSGKRLRPIMALLTCEAISGDHEAAIPLAAAIELIHNYSLIHDDIADRDEDRRGRPTVWKIWGDGLAINTGSVLYTLAFKAVMRLNLPPQRLIAMHKIVLDTSIRLSEGQHWDISYERRVDVDEAMYLNMIAGKTAALLEASTRLGAMVASDDAAIIDAYGRFGHHLGLAFQIQDDYLNIWIDTAESGKTQYSDLRNKKKSLPVTYALGKLQGADRERLAAIYADVDHDMTDDEIATVLKMLAQIDAERYTRDLAAHHTQAALACLDETGIHSAAHDQLRDLATLLTGRTA